MSAGGGGAPAAEPRPIPHASATLLYIEDQLANLTLIETILWERSQWRIIPAMQARLGLELARRHRPHVILLDVRLPDLGVDEVLCRLRAQSETADIPVIVISTDSTQATVEGYLAEGAHAVLLEPINVAAFLSLLRRLLPAGGDGVVAG
jgi:CheY-like chemotaxis protein